MLPFGLLAVPLALAAPGPKDPAREALKELEGTWRVVAAEEKGAAATAKDLADSPQTLEIRGDTATVRVKGRVWGEFRVAVDPGARPVRIDFRRAGGAEGGTCHGIYRLDGGKLTLCLNVFFVPDEPEDRPTEFATRKPGDRGRDKGTLLFTHERAKE